MKFFLTKQDKNSENLNYLESVHIAYHVVICLKYSTALHKQQVKHPLENKHRHIPTPKFVKDATHKMYYFRLLFNIGGIFLSQKSRARVGREVPAWLGKGVGVGRFFQKNSFFQKEKLPHSQLIHIPWSHVCNYVQCFQL